MKFNWRKVKDLNRKELKELRTLKYPDTVKYYIKHTGIRNNVWGKCVAEIVTPYLVNRCNYIRKWEQWEIMSAYERMCK